MAAYSSGNLVLSQYSTTGNITWSGAAYNGTEEGNIEGNITSASTKNAAFTAGGNTTTIMVGSDAYSVNWDITGNANTTTITGGDGADTLHGYNNGGTLAGASGKDVYDAHAANIVLKDYAYGEDAVYGNLFTAGNADYFANTGVVTTTTSNSVKLTASNNYYKVTMTDGSTSQNVWFGSATAATMDGSAETSSLIMLGANNGTTADMLLGGSKADTIYAGANDSVYGGAGADSIFASGNSVVVGLSSTSGADTVKGFGTGFTTTEGAGNGTVYLVDNTIAKASIAYDGTGNITVKDGSGKLILTDAGTANYANVLVKDSTATYKVSVAKTSDGQIDVTAANYADIFVGSTGSSLNFATYSADEGVVVDLGNTGLYGDTHSYSGLSTVTGSTNADKLIGSASSKDSLVGGVGNDSLWGGGSAADVLYDTAGSNAYFYGTGDGMDSIESFSANDEIAFISGSVTDMTRAGETLTLKLNSSDTLTVKTVDTSADAKIKINVGGTDYVAKVGVTSDANRFTYTTDTNYYYGSTKTDTVTYAGSDNANIWLDGSKGAQYYSVENLDATTSSAEELQLAGSTAANKITGGTGSTSLWGGAGAVNDTLVGGTGTNAFYFGMGEGSDIITSSNSTDKVMLYNVATSSIASASVSGGSMNIALTDGSTLKLTNYTSNSVNTFVLSDATYTYDSSTKAWTKTA